MGATRLWKCLTGLRTLGPYILIELLLPGGTLLAFLLWLSQRLKRVGFGDVQRLSIELYEADIAAELHLTPAPAANMQFPGDYRGRIALAINQQSEHAVQGVLTAPALQSI